MNHPHRRTECVLPSRRYTLAQAVELAVRLGGRRLSVRSLKRWLELAGAKPTPSVTGRELLDVVRRRARR